MSVFVVDLVDIYIVDEMFELVVIECVVFGYDFVVDNVCCVDRVKCVVCKILDCFLVGMYGNWVVECVVFNW